MPTDSTMKPIPTAVSRLALALLLSAGAQSIPRTAEGENAGSSRPGDRPSLRVAPLTQVLVLEAG